MFYKGEEHLYFNTFKSIYMNYDGARNCGDKQAFGYCKRLL